MKFEKRFMNMVTAVALSATITSGPSQLVGADDTSATIKTEAPQIIPFEKGPYKVRVERSHFIEMRDGVRLSTDLYFPEDYRGKLPVILERTPYNKANRRNADHNKPITFSSMAYYYASHGFVFAVQDRRGKFESEGEYTISYGDVDDAYDTLEWFEEQNWFNGNVGMVGCSIPGGNVIRAGMSGHKSLKGLVPMSAAFGHGTAGGAMSYTFIRGGVMRLTLPAWAHGFGSKLFYRPSKRLDRDEFLKIADMFDPAPKPKVSIMDLWDAKEGGLSQKYYDAILHLPLVEIDDILGSPPSDWDNMASRPPLDPWWLAGDYLDDEDVVTGGALHINSWRDHGVNETILQFRHFQNKASSAWARENQYLIIGPLSHCELENLTSETKDGERDLGDARFDAWGTYLNWWNYTLKDEKDAIKGMPRVQYFLPGANEWRSSDVWPLEGTQNTKLFLSSGGKANTRLGNGELSWSAPETAGFDHYTYDPADPVIRYAGKMVTDGAFDASEIELRDDILVYTSEPLSKPVEMTGRMKARIWVSTDVPDTDLNVTIVDVHPDGRAFPIQESLLRLRYRDGFDRPKMMETGKIYPIDLDMLVGSNYFHKGHQIRIEVTSSNFPTYGRNLNMGLNNALTTEYQSANVKVYHGPQTPSYIELPFIASGERE